MEKRHFYPWESQGNAPATPAKAPATQALPKPPANTGGAPGKQMPIGQPNK
jgi:hypothetical protein